jgi:hypothetical protein
MRIEEKMNDAYSKAALTLTTPGSLDARVRENYRRELARFRGAPRAPRRKAFLLVAAGVLALVITGFGVQYFSKIGDERFSVEMTQIDAVSYNAETAEVVREQLQQVKDQLQIGEKALVYSSEIKKMTLPKLSGDYYYAEYVSNPRIDLDISSWESKLADKVPQYKLPETGSNALSFVGGKEEMQFGGVVVENDVAKELHSEVESGKQLAWQKIVRESEAFPAYTTVYTDANGAEIYVTMQVMPEKSKMVGMTPGIQEMVALNGQEALFVDNAHFPYSDTQRNANLSWIDTQPDATILYTVGSMSDSVTKEQLISIGESMTAQ